jgi:hypothetical protein
LFIHRDICVLKYFIECTSIQVYSLLFRSAHDITESTEALTNYLQASTSYITLPLLRYDFSGTHLTNNCTPKKMLFCWMSFLALYRTLYEEPENKQSSFMLILHFITYKINHPSNSIYHFSINLDVFNM